jgi:hypothetical protein
MQHARAGSIRRGERHPKPHEEKPMTSSFWKTLAGIAAATLLSAPLGAQEIKISHQFKANTDARDKATRIFVEEVGKKDKNLKFRIYPGSSLNIKPVAQLDALQAGTLEMSVFPMSYAVGKVPEMSATIMPGTITSYDHAMRLKGSDFHKKLQELANKNGIHIVTWWWTPGGFASKERQIGGPDTVKGEKMRAADPTFESRRRAPPSSTFLPPRSIRRSSPGFSPRPSRRPRPSSACGSTSRRSSPRSAVTTPCGGCCSRS